MKHLASLSVAIALASGLAVTGGCNDAPQRAAPPTYPVEGKVLMADGKPPVGATVEFQPTTNQLEMTSMGAVDAEGKFTLSIPYTDRKIPGAIEGLHQVTVRMPLGAERHGGVEFVIPKPYVVRPEANNFTITVPGG